MVIDEVIFTNEGREISVFPAGSEKIMMFVKRTRGIEGAITTLLTKKEALHLSLLLKNFAKD